MGAHGKLSTSMLAGVVAGGKGWKAVTAPDVAFAFLPFDIEKKGNKFRVAPSFDLQTHAGITVAKTYYVKPASEGGNNSSDGLTEATAFATIAYALGRADTDRVLVKAGTYNGTSGWNNASPNRNIEIIAYGGEVISSYYASGLVWGAVDGHYEASYTTNISGVIDKSSPDADGDGIPLVYAADAATVDATPGTWFYDTVLDIIYVNTLDSRAPVGNIYCSIGSSNGRLDDAVTYYIEGITFEGGTRGFLAGVANINGKLYFKDCKFLYSGNNSTTDAMSITGLGEVICQDCIAARNGGDGFKMQPSGAINADLVLIDCIGRNNGLTSSTNANGYSRHGPGNTVAINCEFFGNYGPNVRDVTDGTLTWLLGCYGHDPMGAGSKYNFSMGNATKMWLDTCISEDADTDLYASETAEINYRNMTPASPTTGGTGTIQTY
jgi:hypothetical protein